MTDEDRSSGRRERVAALILMVKETNERTGAAPLEESLTAWAGLKWGLSDRTVRGYLDQLYRAGVFVRGICAESHKPMVWHRLHAPAVAGKTATLDEFTDQVEGSH